MGVGNENLSYLFVMPARKHVCHPRKFLAGIHLVVLPEEDHGWVPAYQLRERRIKNFWIPVPASARTGSSRE